MQIISFSQSDNRLLLRLDSLLYATERLDFKTIMDFTYPKVFKLVPKDQLLAIMEQSFTNEDFSITLDSLKVKKINPVFKIGNASYAVINHTTKMKMVFKEPVDTSDSDGVGFLMNVLKKQFDTDSVYFVKDSNALVIYGLKDLLAVKDEYTLEWCFINLEKMPNILMDKLLSRDLQEKIKEYQ